MKKAALVLSLICLAFVSYAQEDVYKTIASETCDCIKKKNYDYTKISKGDVEMALGFCMLESAKKNNVNVDVNDMEGMTALGQKVGMQMAPICPEVFQALADTKDEEQVEGEDDTEFFTVEGKITSVEEKDFVFVTLKGNDGKDVKFIWLYYFGGSDDFKAAPKKLTGKQVSLTYMVLEVFDPKTKAYYSANILSGLELK
jgi:hypothetical protein